MCSPLVTSLPSPTGPLARAPASSIGLWLWSRAPTLHSTCSASMYPTAEFPSSGLVITTAACSSSATTPLATMRSCSRAKEASISSSPTTSTIRTRSSQSLAWASPKPCLPCSKPWNRTACPKARISRVVARSPELSSVCSSKTLAAASASVPTAARRRPSLPEQCLPPHASMVLPTSWLSENYRNRPHLSSTLPLFNKSR
mmetsp:Transcript_23756/g.31798  ORF Transcript_23756/g.31798 Transcript_23756/m.31798 type:complete len:201 (+) Transcript_23756:1492-2094(+)